MYFKQREDVLFRQYDEYGYITDNSEFGYRMLNDNRPSRGEKFVSQSGAVMLSTLSRRPRHIDDIVDELANIFIGVDCDTLKEDTIEFFQYFLEEGYLSFGETLEECVDIDFNVESEKTKEGQSAIASGTDDCVKSMFKQNEFLRSIHIEIATKKVYSVLSSMIELGLGYLTLGQMSMNLSGGEAQRIKLAKALGVSSRGQNLYILDEPTSGLNEIDIDKFIKVLFTLQEKGETILIIEHNIEFISKVADHVIDFGIFGGQAGGKIVAQGNPKEVFMCKESSLYKLDK